MRKSTWFFFWISIGLILQAKGQEKDSILSDTIGYNYLVLGAEIQPVSSFLARDFGLSLPWVSFQGNYLTSSGIYFSGSIIHFFEPDLKGMYGGGLGYAKALNPSLDLDLGFLYYGGGSYLNSEGKDRFKVIRTTLGWDWGILYSSFQFQALANQPADWMMITQHSRYFQVNQPIFAKGILSFEPRLSLSWGTSNFYRLGDFPLTSDEALENSTFKFQAIEFSLPLTLTFNLLEFALEGTYIKPVHVPTYDSSEPRFFVGGNISYTLPFAKKRK
jgi:hypothetical protein